MAEDPERIRQEIEETRQAIRQEIEETRAEARARSQSPKRAPGIAQASR